MFLKFLQYLIDKFGVFTKEERYGSYEIECGCIKQGEVNAQVYYMCVDMIVGKLYWDDIINGWHFEWGVK